MTDQRLDDGNKESAKELAATFRALFAIAVSGEFLLLSLNARGGLPVCSPGLFRVGMLLGLISIVSMIYLFFLIINKLFHYEEEIVDGRAVKWTSRFAVLSFLTAYVIVGWSLTCLA